MLHVIITNMIEVSAKIALQNVGLPKLFCAKMSVCERFFSLFFVFYSCWLLVQTIRIWVTTTITIKTNFSNIVRVGGWLKINGSVFVCFSNCALSLIEQTFWRQNKIFNQIKWLILFLFLFPLKSFIMYLVVGMFL